MHNTNVLFLPWPLQIPTLKMLKYFCIFSGLVPQCSEEVSQGSVETSWLAEEPVLLGWHLEFGAWTATSAMASPRGKAVAVEEEQWQEGVAEPEAQGSGSQGGPWLWHTAEYTLSHIQSTFIQRSPWDLGWASLALIWQRCWGYPHVGMRNKPSRASRATSQPWSSTSFCGC